REGCNCWQAQKWGKGPDAEVSVAPAPHETAGGQRDRGDAEVCDLRAAGMGHGRGGQILVLDIRFADTCEWARVGLMEVIHVKASLFKIWAATSPPPSGRDRTRPVAKYHGG